MARHARAPITDEHGAAKGGDAKSGPAKDEAAKDGAACPEPAPLREWASLPRCTRCGRRHPMIAAGVDASASSDAQHPAQIPAGRPGTGMHFEDFEVGQVLESRGRTLTESDLVTFAELTGDYNPLH